MENEKVCLIMCLLTYYFENLLELLDNFSCNMLILWLQVCGKFKDEFNGVPITEFVGLRPKMYSYQLLNDPNPDGHHRAKLMTQKLYKILRHKVWSSKTSKEKY